ncbi:hypothetical protein BVRB_5g115040 [Beta vulgaris subsp. vulgaris]|nr:hypothetical protein BVRB_5g115040 [Beta vulgaris subsp. vulgaris]
MDLGPDVKSSSKRSYERFLAKAEGYLHKYQAMHSSSASATASGSSAVTSTGRGDSGGSRHIEFLKKAQDHLNKKDNKNKKDVEDNADFDGQHDYKEHLKLAHAMLKKIKKHKGRHNNGNQGSNSEEQHAQDEDEIEEQHAEDEDEGCWFTELLEGIQEAFEE